MKQLTPRQNEIINTAITIISQNGIQHLTIKNLAKNMNISEPAIYRHFTNKSEILLTLLHQFKNISKQITSSIGEQESAIRQLSTIFEKHVSYFITKPAATSVIFSEEIFSNDPGLAKQIYSLMTSNEKLLFSIISKGQKNKEIRNDLNANELTLIVLGSLRLLVKKWKLSGFAFDLESESLKIWNTIKTILQNNI